MITFYKSVFRINDLYFDEVPDRVDGDIVRYNFWSKPVPGEVLAPHHSIVMDLSLPVDELFEGIHKTARYEIRRAEKENLECGFSVRDCERLVDPFCDFYDKFATPRELPLSDRARLRALAKAGALEINSIRHREGESIVWHAVGCMNGRSLLIHSCSLFRAIDDTARRAAIGRANRLLTWKEIVRWREQGIRQFDFGGWYRGSDDEQMLRINRFKESFGGRVIEVQNSVQGRTLKGRAGLAYLRWKRDRLARKTRSRFFRSPAVPKPAHTEVAREPRADFAWHGEQ